MESFVDSSVDIRVLVAAKHIEYVSVGFFIPSDYRGDETRMRNGIIGFGESDSECFIERPAIDSSYGIVLPVIGSEWVPQLELRVKVEGRESYMKCFYLEGIDWGRHPAFTIIVTKDRERTRLVL